jgi:two-component sensor histidine kinase
VLPFWLLWAGYAPLVAWLAVKRPIERSRVISRSSLHLGVAVAMGFAHTAVRYGLQPSIREAFPPRTPDLSWWPSLLELTVLELPAHVFLYAAILGGAYLYGHQRATQSREVAAARLRAQVSDARVKALRMQLNPHFLFNALNSIAMLVRDAEVHLAVDALEGLSDLLRYALDDTDAQEVKLGRELSFIQRYLAIEKIRFQEGLEVHIEADDEIVDALVPGLVLQPIVENVIRHGVGAGAAPVRITVSARKSGDATVLEVRDDGPGLGRSPGSRATGVGINNTRERLAEMYGDEASLEMENATPHGAVVTIALPFHTTPPESRMHP